MAIIDPFAEPQQKKQIIDPFQQEEQPAAAATIVDPFQASAEEATAEQPSIFTKAVRNVRSALEPLTDLYLGYGKGAATGFRLLSDTLGANNPLSQKIKGVEDYMDALASAQSKGDQKEIAKIMAEAQDKGVADQVVAAVKAFSVAPANLVAQGVGTTIPTLMTGALGTIARIPAFASTLATGAAMGAGTVKGSIYEEVKRELLKAGVEEDQAEKRAQLAQSYGGKNLDLILGGTALGGLAAVTGLEKSVLKQTVSRILGKEAAKKAAQETVKRGAVSTVTRTAAGEAAPEALQGSQEQLAKNVALQREGFDVPTMRGVVGAGTLEALAGAGAGVGAGAVEYATDVGAEDQAEKARRDAEAKAAFTGATTEETSAETPAETVDEETARLLRPVTDEEGTSLGAVTPEAGGAPDVSEQADTGAVGIGDAVSGGPGVAGTTGVAAAPQQPGVDSGALPTGEPARGKEAPSPAVGQPVSRRIEIAGPKGPPSIIPYSQGALDYLNSLSYYGGESLVLAETAKLEEALAAQGLSKSEIDNELKKVRAEYRSLDNKTKLSTAATGSVRVGQFDFPVAPFTPEQGIQFAAAEQAFDDFDSVAYEKVLEPKLKQLADARNAEEGTDKYVPGRPLEFLSKDELISLYKESIGTAPITEEGGEARPAQAARRQEFLQTLDPEERAEFERLYERQLREEILDDASGREKVLSDEGLQKRQREAQERREKLLSDMAVAEEAAKTEVAAREQAKETLKPEEQRAAEEKQEAARAEKQARGIEQKRPSAGALPKVEQGIARGDSVVSILTTISEDTARNSITRVVAKGLLQLTKSLSLDVKIEFGQVEGDADGKFDPDTDTVTLQGADGAYTGKRPLDQAVLHEVMHYLTDHVIENTDAYLKSIKDDVKRTQVRNAINRLNNNYRVAKTALGDKFNIPTMKEFIAETYSNPAFQSALGRLRAPKGYVSTSGFFGQIARNIANALGFIRDEEITSLGGGEAGVRLKEVLEDIAQIVSLPTADVRATEVSYAKRKAAEPKKAEELREGDLYDNAGYEIPQNEAPKRLKFLARLVTFRPDAWRSMARTFQNDRYPIKNWEDKLDMGGKIFYTGKDKLNNIFTQITLSTGRARNLHTAYVQPLLDDLQVDVSRLANALKMNTDKTLGFMHRVLETLHEEERRRVKYILTVPLSTVKNMNGGTLSAADRREQIIRLLDSKKLSEAQAKQLRAELDAIINAKNPDGSPRYLDPLGSSPRAVTKKDGTKVPLSIVESDPLYNVLGLSSDAIAKRREQYENNPNKALIDKVLADLKALNDVTADLSKMSNYWSQFVSNRVAFYDYKNYAPFKGRGAPGKAAEIDEILDFDSAKMGKELQEVAYSFDGRTSVSDNPVLQTASDAVRAAMRAGRRDLTQSIKNAIQQKLLPGKIKETIKFEDRDSDRLKALKGETTIFHYNPDGTIDVLSIEDKQLRDAVRRTYKDLNPLADLALNLTSSLTSGLGKMHTRFNVNFPPLNFVRDALTNAFTLGAELGPTKAAQLLSTLAANVVTNNGLPKAAEVMVLIESGNFSRLQALAENDPMIKDMVDFVKEGGMVTYIQGLSIKSNFEELNKRVGRSGIITASEDAAKLMDIYINMFELASRASAYKIVKQDALANGKSEEEAKTRAAAYAKNLANFEQVGEWGRLLGGLYMFFRPAATGAVRAIEATAPAFRSMDAVVNEAPEAVKADPEAMAKYKAAYASKQTNARIMVGALMGLGYVTFLLSQMGSDDDDLGRNQTLNDNMQQWTRFARFHIPKSLTDGKEITLQMPWGFGLGAFAAAGAQIAAVEAGTQSVKEAAANIFLNIALDSFIPLPVSRISPLESPMAFFMDSITPSIVRPVLELTMNKDGLGRDITSASGRRYADAYVSGTNVPEIYNAAAEYMFDESLGKLKVSPNELYFLANSYADGVAKMAEYAYGFADLKEGRKEFNPKTDIPLLGSFFGARSSLEGREYAALMKEMDDVRTRVRTFELKPEQEVRYESKYPTHSLALSIYDSMTQGTLKDLQAEATQIRVDPNLEPKDRTYLLRQNRIMQSLEKREILDTMKVYGIEP